MKTKIASFIAGLGVGIGGSCLVVFTKAKSPMVEEEVEPAIYFERGLPKAISNVINRNAYSVSFNKFTRNPDWTVYKLNKSDLDSERPDRHKSHFKEDHSIPLMWRTHLTDFISSGFDRGHLVPAADTHTQNDMDDTFYLSNMSPQVGLGFNRGYWRKLEWFIRRKVGPSFDQVIVYTGPLYLPRQDSDNTATLSIKLIGNPPSIFVPTHFFKVILAKKGSEYYHAAFVLPNEAIDRQKPLTDFLTPIDVISRSAGFKLFDESKTRPLCNTIECAFPKGLKSNGNESSKLETLLVDNNVDNNNLNITTVDNSKHPSITYSTSSHNE